MPQQSPKIRVATSQSHTLSTPALTLSALESTTIRAASSKIDLLLFPEAYLGGYPRTATFGASIGARTTEGREQYLRYFRDSVDFGDTPEGAGGKWVNRELEGRKEDGIRGDGTREELERISRETGVFLVVGVVERAGGTLYCGVVYVCPKLGIVGKRRKVMPTGSERLIWGQGQPSSLRAITTTIKGVKITLAAAICWENYMPLLRQSLYSQNVNLYLAPTADGRDTWLPLMRTIAMEGRCVVLSANQCVTSSNLPGWITGEKSVEGSTGVSGGVKVPPTVPPKHNRRKSTCIPCEDGNEIVLPLSPSLDRKNPALTKEKTKDDEKRGRNGETNGHGHTFSPRAKLRRKSTTIIEDGNEIVLPDLAPEDEEAVSSVHGRSRTQSPLPPPHVRRKSTTVIVDGNEIIVPLTPAIERTAPLLERSPEEEVEAVRSRYHSPLPPPKLRRKSTIVDTDDGNEIVFPESPAVERKPPNFNTTSFAPSASNQPAKHEPKDFVSRGGSCIISPLGEVLAGPLWEEEDGLVVVDVDFDDCLRGRLDIDVGGSYSRSDAFKLSVEGLDLSPPP